MSASSVFGLRFEHVLDRLVAQHDALERVHVDLVELAALGAEADGQERDERVLRALRRGDRAGEQL